jgi:hypothetical protein
MTDPTLVAYFDPELKGRTILRRYLDLPKLIDLLRTGELFLGQASRFEDRLEGTLPEGIRRSIRNTEGLVAQHGDPTEWERKNRERTYLGCWSLGAKDNMALWKLYGRTNESVAITTTVESMSKVAPQWARYGKVSIKKIRYIDHDGRLPDGVYAFDDGVFGFKHLAYAFEKEVRIVMTCPTSEVALDMQPALRVPIDVNTFLRSIVVAPEAGDWFFNLVEEIAKKYGVSKPVRRSALTHLIARISR